MDEYFSIQVPEISSIVTSDLSQPENDTSSSPVEPVEKTEKRDVLQVFVTNEIELKNGNQVSLIPRFRGRIGVSLVSGEAEVFGKPLVKGEWHDFVYPQRSVVASSSGCVLAAKTTEFKEEVRVIKDDQFPTLVGCAHVVMDAKRIEAIEASGDLPGPKVLVVGPIDSGKSSACKTLLNYALTAGWNPTYVDFDPGQQGISLPGIFSGYVMKNSLEDSHEIQVADRFDLPYGRTRLNEDLDLYLQQVRNMSRYVFNNFKKSPPLAASGCIINTAGWVDEEGIATLLNIAQIFQVNTVLVMDSVSLGHRFRSWSCQTGQELDILFIPKPMDLTIRDIENRRDYRECLVRKCFLPKDIPVATYKLPLDQVVFYRLASFHTITLRNGRKMVVCNQVLSAGDCLNYVMAISDAPNLEVDVKSCPIHGYAILLYFKSSLNEACLASTLDLSRFHRRPVVLVRTELRGPHSSCFDTGSDRPANNYSTT